MIFKYNNDLNRTLTVLTSSDMIQRSQHPQHERGWNCNGVSSLFQHEFVSIYNLRGKLNNHIKDQSNCTFSLKIRRTGKNQQVLGGITSFFIYVCCLFFHLKATTQCQILLIMK